MQRQNPSSTDLFQQKSSLRILQHEPILSSHSAGWKGVLLRHYHLPPHEFSEYCPQQHVIIAHYQQPSSVDRTLDGQKKSLVMGRGEITVVPAHAPHQASWNEALDLIVLILNPEFISHVAHEWIDPSQIELAPHFSNADPFVSQIGSLLKDALQTSGAESRFYAESMAVALAAHLIRHYSVKNVAPPNPLGGSIPNVQI
ncbi:hypothetical protein ACQ4M3_35040 [Leptolyngbya sp. AN03gr2]|uniref:hypothetical protein n=1 Tax=unclassified Leptolyngbya TaxID=2650499 RepID=UPI003D312C70